LLYSRKMRNDLLQRLPDDLGGEAPIPFEEAFEECDILAVQEDVMKAMDLVFESLPFELEEVVEALLSSGKNLEMGDDILTIAKKQEPEEVRELLAHFVDITEILGEQASKADLLNKSVFRAKVVERGGELLHSAAALKPEEDLRDLLTKTEKYHTDVIAWGALFRAALVDEMGEMRSPEELEQILGNIEVDVLSAGDLVTRDEGGVLQFPHPEKFNEEDYAMIESNLELAYEDIDPGWLKYLKANIERDLQDSGVTFILIRNEEGELVGVDKTKPLNEEKTVWYNGTLYVEPAYQKGFSLGNYLREMAATVRPEGVIVQAVVAKNNPIMEVSIESAGGIITGTTIETDGTHSSDTLFQIEYGRLEGIASRALSREDIVSKASLGGKVIDGEGRMIACKINAHRGEDEDFVRDAQNYFSQGFALTRMFFESESDMRQGYVVFEDLRAEDLKLAA